MILTHSKTAKIVSLLCIGNMQSYYDLISHTTPAYFSTFFDLYYVPILVENS